MKAGLLCSTVATLAIALGACGASKKEIRQARTSGYEADFAVVYTEVLGAVSALYPHLSEDASAGVIRTKWHPINIDREGTQDGLSAQQRDEQRANQRNDPSMATGALTGTNLQRKRYFIRFDVHVVGGKPWRVQIRSQASEWEMGAVPVELRGADEPHWLPGRTDALYVQIYRRLKAHAVPLKTTSTDEAPAVAKVDYSVYGDLPEAAAKTVHGVAMAAKVRDYAGLRMFMDDEFAWSLGGDPSAEQALVMWQADSSAVTELARVIGAGCAVTGDRVECPAAAAPGYRAVFELRGGVWLMTSFLAAE